MSKAAAYRKFSPFSLLKNLFSFHDKAYLFWWRFTVFQRASVTIFHVRGIPIRLHISLLILLPLLVFWTSEQFAVLARLAGVHQVHLLLPPLVWGILLAVALLVGVVLHELGHSLVAIKEGVKVSSINLMFLGGVSEMEEIPLKPWDEAKMSLAGPLVSLLIGGILLALFLTLHIHHPDARLGLFWLAQINLVIGVFNLLPAFPMDGGRVLRAALNSRLGLLKATQVAVTVGKVMAILFIIAAIFTVNLLLGLIGLFVWFGGDAERRAIILRQVLAGLKVRDFLSMAIGLAGAKEPAAQLAGRMLKERVEAYAVVDDSQRILGLIGPQELGEARRVGQDRLAEQVMLPKVPVVHLDDPLRTAFELMVRYRVPFLPVVDDNHLVGMVSFSDIERGLEKRQALSPLQTREI
jgi:Zn-dependent protease